MSGVEFDDGETHATDLSASFYSRFQATKNDISARLESLDSSAANPSTDGVDLNSLSSDIVKLRKDLVDATSYLPSYDRGKCEQQLKALEESLSKHRAPKSKFSFKRKPAGTSAPPPNLPPTHVPSPTAPAPATTNLTLSSHIHKYLTFSSLVPPPTTPAADITFTDLNTCIVDLITPQQLKITALHGRSLHRVVLVLPPIEGSVLLHDVHDSIVVVGCHQFRMHDSRNTTVLLHVTSTPIIEGSSSILFGAYPPALLNSFAGRLSSSSPPAQASQHTQPQDFDWIKPSASPNWGFLEPSSESEAADRVTLLINDGGNGDVIEGLDAILG